MSTVTSSQGWLPTLLIGSAFCLSAEAALAAGGFGGAAGFGGGAAGFGAAGFGGGSTRYGGPTAGYGIQPRVAAPIPGQPLAPIGYDAGDVGPPRGSGGRTTTRRQHAPTAEQPRLYNAVGAGSPRYDQGAGGYPSAAQGPGVGAKKGIWPPDGSGYLVIEDDQGGATIYGPNGVRRVKNFDRSQLSELTRP